MISDTIVTMMIQFPSVAGLAYALYVLSRIVLHLTDTIERLSECKNDPQE